MKLKVAKAREAASQYEELSSERKIYGTGMTNLAELKQVMQIGQIFLKQAKSLSSLQLLQILITCKMYIIS